MRNATGSSISSVNVPGDQGRSFSYRWLWRTTILATILKIEQNREFCLCYKVFKYPPCSRLKFKLGRKSHLGLQWQKKGREGGS